MLKFYQAIGWVTGKLHQQDDKYILKWNNTATPIFFLKVSKKKIQTELIGKPLVFCVYPIVSLSDRNRIKKLKFQCVYWDNAFPLEIKPNTFILKGIYAVLGTQDEQNYIKTFRNPKTKNIDKTADLPRLLPIKYENQDIPPVLNTSRVTEENYGYFLQLKTRWDEENKTFITEEEIENPSRLNPKRYVNGKDSNKPKSVIERKTKPSLRNNQAGHRLPTT